MSARRMPSLLLADDDLVIRTALRFQLEEQFSIVGVAPDARTTVTLASERRPDVAVVDVEMPGGGLDAARGVQRESPGTAVVILTSDRSREAVLPFVEAGAVAFLRKGIGASELAARLHDCIAAHAARSSQDPAVRLALAGRAVAEERFRAAFDQGGVGMAIVVLEGADAGRLLAANGAYARLVGREASELVGANLERWTHPDDLPDGIGDPLARLARGEARQIGFEHRYVHRDGGVIDVATTAAAFVDEDARHVAIVQAIDVSDRKRNERRLGFLADHDPLTGLPNRRRFIHELDRELTRAQRYGSRGAVLGLDLDGFKLVNDSLGHSAGDELIASLATAMRDGLRDSDLLARMGGDEFAAILPEADAHAARAAAEKLLAIVRRCGGMTSGGARVQVSASIGAALFAGGEDVLSANLLVAADRAMYEAKRAGKNGIRIDDARNRRATAAHDQPGWRRRLLRGIADERFVLHAQPVVAVCSRSIPRFELLLRLHDEQGGLLAPAAFLGQAERFSLIESLDRWVMSEAVRLLYERDLAGQAISLSINLSGASLASGAVVSQLRQLLAERPLPPGLLVVEISESVANADPRRGDELAHALRELGCRLAIDDFGSAHGTLGNLGQLSFDYLKIDGDLITRLPGNRADQLVVQAIIDIARGLNADTIAKFVPNEQTLALLRELGVGYAQGYHTGRPGPIEAVLPPVSPTSAARGAASASGPCVSVR